MFFENLNDISKITTKTNCAIFVVPKNTEVVIPGAMILAPEGRQSIAIEQVHNMTDTLKTRQNFDRFIVIRPAEAMTAEAANAILKNLEEPQEKVHFVLMTDSLTRLMPTIRSRAEIYVWRGGISKISDIDADEKIKAIAKKILIAKPGDLVGIAEEICKKKDGARENALSILSTAVEMAYKSYFITGKSIFLAKIPGLLKAHESISANGHIKLHLVADLI
ncbi:hypothetical protein IJI79_02050 [Candidatus Saccharibacteria bacterium]|nr:hypothetical protein [Candidatus Saccharibacteria bacterium]